MRRRSKAPSTDSAYAAESTAVAGRKARGLFGLVCLCVVGLVAFTGTGAPSAGAAESFPGQGFLPHNRAWELVSPPDKNGGDVIPKAVRTRAALTGGAVTFSSLQGFGDVAGFGAATEYLSQREGAPGTSGWSTHGITPPQEQMTLLDHLDGIEPRYEWEMSADLTYGIFRALSPLTADPYVANAVNFYLRDDLRTPGAGVYQLLTGCPLCEKINSPIPPSIGNKLSQIRPWLAGASDDFGHVIFEARLQLMEEATPGSYNLYESDHGTVRLVGVLPSGATAPVSLAGQGASNNVRYTTHPISSDGSRIVFTVPNSGDTEGNLYQRVDHSTTLLLNRSERAIPDEAQPAKYWDASSDGSRVFFTTPEALTEDALVASSKKLYMWKQAEADEQQTVAVDATGGTFTLGFNEATTEPISFDASAASVQSAIEALSSVEPGNVTVSGGPGSAGAATPYEVTFTGDLSGSNVAQLEADGSALTGGASTATVATTQAVNNLTLLNIGQGLPDQGSSVEGVIGSSDDGHYVYFITFGHIRPEDPGSTPLYLWHDGAISYVANVSKFGNDSSEMYDGANSGLNEKQTRVTLDGRHLLFPATSGQGLLSAHGGTDYDHGTDYRELYVYSADTDELHCATCNPSGAPATASATDMVAVNVGAAQPVTHLSYPISDDGRYVFFSTAERLVSKDTNGQEDAYVYDTVAQEPQLISSGRSASPSYFLDASADGKDAFFTTIERLSGWDVDGNYDLYDARLGGGLPEPPPPPPSCEGDACQPAPLNLNDPTPSSSGFQGPGDPVAGRPTRCRKGQRQVRNLGRTRCVKRKQGSKRNANSNRRAGR